MGLKILPVHFSVQDLLPTLLILEETVSKQEEQLPDLSETKQVKLVSRAIPQSPLVLSSTHTYCTVNFDSFQELQSVEPVHTTAQDKQFAVGNVLCWSTKPRNSQDLEYNLLCFPQNDSLVPIMS